jgi:hypothetical protein
MKRKPARLLSQQKSQPESRPARPLAHQPAGSESPLPVPERPSLADIHAALDEIAKEWGIRL